VPLDPVFFADLEASGLTPRDAKDLDFIFVPAGKPCKWLASNIDRDRDLFTLFYHDAAGKRTGFYRVRYTSAPSGFQKYALKPQRYSQPAGSPPALYIPKNFKFWAALFAEPSLPLVVTEGEKKAACACKFEIPTVALGGVNSYQSKKLNKRVLEEIEAIKFAGRKVYIVFDTDIRLKPEVRRAANAFAEQLLRLGAIVYEIILPDVKETGKTGLDDFLVTKGKDAKTLFQALQATAKPFADSSALHEMSTLVAYVKEPPHIIELSTNVRMNRDIFLNLAFADKVHLKENKDGKLVEVSTAKQWTSWPAKNIVRRLTYKPGEPRYTSENELNLWTNYPVAPKRGSVRMFLDLFEHLTQGMSPENREWFLSWTAYPLQHPGTKMYSAVLLWGKDQGTGKSLYGYSVGRVYGKENYSEIGSSHLHDKFNSWAINKQFVVGDEISGGNKKVNGEHVKRLVTQETIRINEKYVPTIVMPDCLNYYFTSNHADAFILEDGDRRFFIHEVVSPPLTPAFYEPYDAWYRSDEGAAAILYYLLNYDTKKFNPKARAPMSYAKQEMIDTSLSDIDVWVRTLLDNPEQVLSAHHGKLNPCDLYESKQLRAYYDPHHHYPKVTANVVSRALKSAGARRVGPPPHQLVTAHGTVRLWAICNAERWGNAKSAEIRAYYDKAFPLIAVSPPKHS